MSAHAVVRQVVPAGIEETFDLIHDYPARLEWDTLLRRAETVGGAAPAQGVEAICSARWSLGGMTFRTRYVTFSRPELAAVTLVGRPPLFASWAASIRHHALADDVSELIYTLTFRCRPKMLAPLVEPVALATFRWETARRLRALARPPGAVNAPSGPRPACAASIPRPRPMPARPPRPAGTRWRPTPPAAR